MLDEVADAIRNTPGVYRLRKLRYERRFFSNPGDYWGLLGSFASMEEARRYTDHPEFASYDNEAVVDVLLDYFSTLSLFDYPVLYWLNRLIDEESLESLVDFGGHVGVKYYAYTNHVRLPSTFKWAVVDVPAMVRRGEKKSREAGSPHLEFHTRIEDAPHTSLLFCSGSLMYVNQRIDQIVPAMKAKPDYLLINKLAVLPDKEIVALEGFGNVCVPYRVFSDKHFRRSVDEMGYELVDSWEIPDRTHSVPFVDEARGIKSIGQVWKHR